MRRATHVHVHDCDYVDVQRKLADRSAKSGMPMGMVYAREAGFDRFRSRVVRAAVHGCCMRWLVVGVTVWIAACHDSVRGRGSEACREWQDALCTYAADRCGAMTREECDAQYRGVTCKSDKLASDCADEFDAARCGFATARCDLDAVADPAPARKACERLFERLCERAVECSTFDSVEACTGSEAVQAIDCGRAIAYSLTYESCYDKVHAIACGELADELRLPPGCSDVITLSE